MSAVLKDEPRLVPMHDADLAEVMAIEGAIYSHPWTHGNFADSLRAGYHCWTWRSGRELLGYFVLLVAAGEGHLLNLSVAAIRLRLQCWDCASRAASTVAWCSTNWWSR